MSAGPLEARTADTLTPVDAGAGSAKILIVEDDPDIGGLLAIHLRRAGYQTVHASDAVTFLTVARKEQPDLILLDLGLPGGDGLLVMERMKGIASLSRVPVIVVSARDPISSGPQALAAGAHAFLGKPIDTDRLLETVRDALTP